MGEKVPRVHRVTEQQDLHTCSTPLALHRVSLPHKTPCNEPYSRSGVSVWEGSGKSTYRDENYSKANTTNVSFLQSWANTNLSYSIFQRRVARAPALWRASKQWWGITGDQLQVHEARAGPPSEQAEWQEQERGERDKTKTFVAMMGWLGRRMTLRLRIRNLNLDDHTGVCVCYPRGGK